MDLPYRYITQPKQRDEALLRLSAYPVIGIDIEGDSLFHYQDKVCLIQISGGKEHFIFDPLLLDTVTPLSSLFQESKIVKVFHGAEYDLISLKRDFGFTLVSLFDTVLAARAAGIKSFSLQNLVSLFFKIELKKTHQKANWSKRPIPPDQLNYAYLDTCFLPALYERLLSEVEKKGRLDQIKEECLLLEEKVWAEKEFSPDNYLKIKGARDLAVDFQKILRELVVARDKIAKELDRPPFKIISNEDLIILAKQKPSDLEEIKKAFPRKTAPVYRNASYWLRAISRGKASADALPITIKNKGTRPSPDQEKRFAALKKWRDAQAFEEGVEPSMIISTDVLRAIVNKGPCDLDQLSESSLLRQWQLNRYGQKLLSYLTSSIH